MDTKHRDEYGNPKYTNHLVSEASPYLLAHAHNPVDWFPWGEEAFRTARDLDKPVLISIGYRSCHWCGVQAGESFDDEDTAQLQNELFVNIKVDREERPDIDSIYMSAVQAMTGRGGWPLNVFCLPDGTPFYGGTYFPPDEKAARYRMPSWKQVLQGVAEAYHNRRDEVTKSGRELLDHLSNIGAAVAQAAPLPDAALLGGAFALLADSYDERDGGFGNAPKFPQPMTLEFLLRMHLRGETEALPMLSFTLRKMARGGIYDQLGGGFHRYSVDARWLVPHFEKMLYDNAQLARVYLETYQAGGDALFRTIAEETLAYLEREMLHPSGGFYSTQDADSLPYPGAAHPEEGAFFVWAPEQLIEHLGVDAALFSQIYDVSHQGNFEGRNILNLPRELEDVAWVTGITTVQLRDLAARGRLKLFAARERRPRPFRDEKIITAWNGMALRAFAAAAMALGDPHYAHVARRNAEFLLGNLRREDGRLLRSWKDGQAGPLGFLEDYAGLADGLLALYTADGDPRWLTECLRLSDELIDLFWDDGLGGFYDTARDHEALITRPREVGDNAVPSGSSTATELLLRLAALTGRADYREHAERSLAGVAAMIGQFPAGFGRMLCAADLADWPLAEVAIVGDPQAADTRALLEVVQQPYRPHVVVAQLRPGDTQALALTPLLHDRSMIDGRATAYVCEHFVCKLPVTTPEALAEQLASET